MFAHASEQPVNPCDLIAKYCSESGEFFVPFLGGLRLEACAVTRLQRLS
jgi:hypothetical protein